MRPLTLAFGVFFLALAAHGVFSWQARDLQAAWANVPPVPTEEGATILALGDRQFAYRSIGIMIQNLGDTGGRTTPLYEYDYERLAEWFFLEHKLDPRADFIPLLAAYYFGATQTPEELDPVIEYLAVAGQRPEPQKWRWLAQAVYLARFRRGDLDKALELAHILASLYREGMPGWTRQMPAFIAAATGDKETALAIMTAILRDDGDKLHPNEINFMIDFICTRLLQGEEAATYPLCLEGNNG